jgi:hypothetical protein
MESVDCEVLTALLATPAPRNGVCTNALTVDAPVIATALRCDIACQQLHQTA